MDGQGVLGLRAAFAIAGAKGLVMSLWPVNDKAGRLFMQYFYSHLDAGPAEAVRQAQLDMVAKTEFKQPVYWAGYAYSGDSVPGDLRRASAAPANGAGESLVAPTCVELTTHRDDGNWTLLTTYRLKISGACPLILPCHVALDRAREKARGAAAIGTTGRGIGPAYEDKVARRAIRVADLAEPETVAGKLD